MKEVTELTEFPIMTTKRTFVSVDTGNDLSAYCKFTIDDDGTQEITDIYWKNKAGFEIRRLT